MGEGAQKFITIRISGAASDQSARTIGPCDRQFAAGEDRDCRRGRELGPRGHGVGKAGEPADRDKLSIAFERHLDRREGLPVEDYDEAPVAAHLKGEEIDIAVETRPSVKDMPPCGPAISPTATSPSTRITDHERAR